MKNENEKLVEMAKGIGGGLGYFVGLLIRLGLLWIGLWVLHKLDMLEFLKTGV